MATPRNAAIVLDEVNAVISLNTDTQVLLSGTFAVHPRSLAVTILVPGEDSRVCLMADCASLRPGVWTLAINMAAYDPVLFRLHNAGNGDLIVYGMTALADISSDPALLMGATQRRDGVAFVSQSVESNLLTYDVILIPPLENISVYRLGLHLLDPRQDRYYGVWGLDFAPGSSWQRGQLRLDLSSRVAQGEVNGMAVPVDLGPFDIEVGDIDVQTAWWRLDVPSYLALYRSARFSRDAASQIKYQHYQNISPTILLAP